MDDKYRGIPHPNCILMHPQDAESANLRDRSLDTVQGDAGQLEHVELIYGSIRPGAVLMFYAEANVLFKAKIEQRSGIPAFKRVPAIIYAQAERQGIG